MGLKYLLLMRFGLINIVAFALLGAAWAQGLVAKVINSDITNTLEKSVKPFKKIGNSAKLGKGEWCVLESDESDGSFLQLPFTYSIITNIDEEHIEHYGSINNLKSNFIKFAEKKKLGKYGNIDNCRIYCWLNSIRL